MYWITVLTSIFFVYSVVLLSIKDIGTFYSLRHYIFE